VLLRHLLMQIEIIMKSTITTQLWRRLPDDSWDDEN